MLESIRRHQKWLWFIIVTLTIISFVVFFSPQQGQMSGPRNESVGTIHGEPISRNEYLNALQEARLRFWFNYQRWPQDDPFARQLGLVERDARTRLLLLRKLDDFDIKVSETAIAHWIAETFKDPQQNTFRKDLFDEIIQEIFPRQGIRSQDFYRFVRNELGIQHLIALTGLSGQLITPQEAESVFRKRNEEVDTQAVFVSATNFLDQVNIDPAALAAFYTNNAANYRTPEKVQVTYVKFDATNYLAEAEKVMAKDTNLAMRVEAFYAERGTNYYKDAAGQPLPAEAGKEKARDDLAQQYALSEAHDRAVDFADALIDQPQQDATALAKLAEERGLTPHVTEPFTQNQRLPGLDVPPNFTQIAFQLTAQEPIYYDVIVGESAVYLMALQNRVPSELPPLDQVRERVAEDYRKQKAAELAEAAGRELYHNLTNQIASGKAFQEAVSELQLGTLVDLPPFSQETSFLPEVRSPAMFTAVKNAALALTPEQVSSFSPAGDGGVIVHLQTRQPVSEEKFKKEFPKFLSSLREERRAEAYNEWLRKELDMARISLVGDEQNIQAN